MLGLLIVIALALLLFGVIGGIAISKFLFFLLLGDHFPDRLVHKKHSVITGGRVLQARALHPNGARFGASAQPGQMMRI